MWSITHNCGLITIDPGDFLVGARGTMFENFDKLFKTALMHRGEGDKELGIRG